MVYNNMKNIKYLFIFVVLFSNRVFALNDFDKLDLKSPVLGIKQSSNIDKKFVFLEMKEQLSDKTFFFLFNNDQVFSKNVKEKLFPKLDKYNYEDLKKLSMEEFSSFLVDSKFVIAKDLKIGDEINTIWGIFVVKSIHNVDLSKNIIIRDFLDKQKYLFFYVGNFNNNSLFKNYFSIKHLDMLSKFIIIGILSKFFVNMLIENISPSEFWTKNNFLKQFSSGTLISMVIGEAYWNIFNYYNKKIHGLLTDLNMSFVLDTYKMVPFKLDFLFYNKYKLKISDLPIIKIDFKEAPFSSNDSKNKNLITHDLLIDDSGNFIKNEQGEFACLTVLNLKD